MLGVLVPWWHNGAAFVRVCGNIRKGRLTKAGNVVSVHNSGAGADWRKLVGVGLRRL